MAQTHSSTEKRTFGHLTEIERGEIAAYLDLGLSLRKIGDKLGRSASTISREIKRGSVQRIDTFRNAITKYFPDAGACVYKENCKNCEAHSTVMKAWEFVVYAEKKILENEWSPDAIVGYAKRLPQFKDSYIPSTKPLYNWIDEGKLTVINLDLAMKMRRSTKKNKPRKHKRVLGKSIAERPECIDTREEFGHWEIDTVLGKKSNGDALLTLVERKTRKEIITRIPNKDAPSVKNALRAIFTRYQE